MQNLLKTHLRRKPQGEEQEVVEILKDAIRTNRLACERIVKIVRSLRNFARLDEAERKKVDIHEGIESTLTLVAHELKRRIKVIKEFGAVREIECYPNQLNQVFMNMLVNASQSIEGEGEIRIRTWEEDNAVRIAISDNGKGIPKNSKRRYSIRALRPRRPDWELDLACQFATGSSRTTGVASSLKVK